MTDTDANNYPKPVDIFSKHDQALANLKVQAARLDEFVANVNAYAQRAYWSLTIEQAEQVNRLLTEGEAFGVRNDGRLALSGDHRPRFRYVVPTKPAVLGRVM